MDTIGEAFEEAESEASGEVGASEVVEEAPEGAEPEGQVDETTASEETSSEELFNLDEYGDKFVEVKIDGQVERVPVAELRDGYMRQSAFTQKTQALAQEKQEAEAAIALASAYAQNPEATIRFLADQNGITLAQATAVAEAAEQDSWEAGEQTTADPRMDAFEQRFAELDRREARMEVESTLTSLGQRFGEDFDPQTVVNRAIADGSDDLEGTFMRMQGEKFYAEQQAKQAYTEKQDGAEAQATAAKAALAGTVTSGSSSASAGGEPAARITNIADAFAAAGGDDFFN